MGFLWALWVAVAAPTAYAASVSTAPGALDHEPVILVFGDSISAGYGIHVEQGWVSLLTQKITQLGYGFRVVNASVSGETTAGGLSRLPHAIDVQHPQILILELGGNDGLRSLPLETTHDNLDKMIQLARSRDVRVLLVGMRMPPNYGERYTTGFQNMYTDLAQRYKLPLVPFLLEKVALNPAMMQADGIHPTEPAEPLLLDTVWPRLQPLLGPRKP
jgi:acyl-CoA thioesterase-1